MRIGILETGRTVPEIDAKYGQFPDMFAQLLKGHDFSFTAYHVENMEFPPSASAQDGWLITGSKHGAYEDHAFIPPLEDLIRQIHAAKRPLIGVCFGHQIIATALGGRVEKFAGGWGLGLSDYTLDGSPVRLNAWHQDQVTTLPPEARRVGASDFCQNAALSYGDHIFTIQPHPEFSGPLIADYVALRRGTSDYEDDRMARAAARSTQPDDNAALAARIADVFLRAQERQNA